ncbi:hypothetical protein [Mollivirus kamchatka]|nr:hypothetical protein [Mollivirus kamchatka]
MTELVEESVAGGLPLTTSPCYVRYYGLHLCSDSHDDNSLVIMLELRPREHDVVVRVLKRIARAFFDSPEVPPFVLALGVDTSPERLSWGDPSAGTINVCMGYNVNLCALYAAALYDNFLSRLTKRNIRPKTIRAHLKQSIVDGLAGQTSSPIAHSLAYNLLLLRTLPGRKAPRQRLLFAEAVSLLGDVCDLVDDIEALAAADKQTKSLGTCRQLSVFGVDLPVRLGLFLVYEFMVRRFSAKFFRDKVDRPSRRYWSTLLGPVYYESTPGADEPRALLGLVCAYYLMWHTMEMRTQTQIENLHGGSFCWDEPSSPAPFARRHLLCGGRLALATFDTFDPERADEMALAHLRRLRADLSGDSWNYLATHFDFTREDNESRAQQTESLVRALKILKRDHPKSQ